ncbi:MAG: hypothetical protein IT305_07845 [Chloroflexi bacterium]|nr:hypothetical protein [Chloroflexota bacterium]
MSRGQDFRHGDWAPSPLVELPTSDEDAFTRFAIPVLTTEIQAGVAVLDLGGSTGENLAIAARSGCPVLGWS